MRKATTTTKKLSTAITNGLLQITKAEIYHKSTWETEIIDTGTFQESLDFLCESIFMDCIGWHYEKDYKTGQYIIETGRMNLNTEVIVAIYLGVCDGVKREDIDMVLSVVEEEWFIEQNYINRRQDLYCFTRETLFNSR